MLEQLERLADGRPALAVKVWELPGAQGESLVQYNSRRKLGGCTAEGADRCREAFGHTAKGRKIYAMDGGAAHNHQHVFLTQADVGKPRPPSLRDAVRSTEEMAESLIEYCVKLMEVDEVNLVEWTDTRLHELLVTLFPQYKPGDWQHLDPRWCLNLAITNAPVKSATGRVKFHGGIEAVVQDMHTNDLMAAIDGEKGYKQVPQTYASGIVQRCLVPLDVWESACSRVAQKDPTRAKRMSKRTRWLVADGIKCVILHFKVVQFGGTRSRDHFEIRFGFPVAELRQRRRMRLTLQVDDCLMQSRFGPTLAYTDLLFLIGQMTYFKWIIHLTAEKAAQAWPASVATFDGAVIRPRDLQLFVPVDRDQRHGRSLSELLAKGEYSLQQGASVVGEQRSNARAHAGTAELLAAATSHLSKETRRITGGNPAPELWQLPMRPFSGVALEHLTRLIEPRLTGARARREGGPAATVIADSSNYCVGYRVQFHTGVRTGQTIRGRIPFTHIEWERRHHTHLEAIGLGLVLEMTIKYGELKGDEVHYLWINSFQDNKAAVKNFNRPGGKVHMVNGTMASKWLAMENYIQIPVQYGCKEMMDDWTNVDFDGRPTYHDQDLGLPHKLVEMSCRALMRPMDEYPTVDCCACRSTRQEAAVAYITRYPDGAALPQVDILSYHFRSSPEFRGRFLYIHPPEVLLPKILAKIRGEQVDVILTVPLHATKQGWWATFAEMVTMYVTVWPNEDEWVQPPHSTSKGPVAPAPFPLIIARLSSVGMPHEGWMLRPGSSSASPMWMGRAELAYSRPRTCLSSITASSKEIQNESDLNKIGL